MREREMRKGKSTRATKGEQKKYNGNVCKSERKEMQKVRQKKGKDKKKMRKRM